MVIKHNQCRLCNSKDIVTVLDFGETALANAFLEKPDQEEVFAPLEVFSCKNCGSFQLKHTVDPTILFNNYLYESSTSSSFQEHFRQYAVDIVERFCRLTNELVCDIGSNDGILLKPLRELGCRILGVEPAVEIAAKANRYGILTIPSFFTADVANDIKEDGPCRIVTANNVFAHIDNLHEIIEGVKTILDYNGVFIFENAYLLDTLNNLYFDQVYSEHLYYHSLKPLIKLFAQHDMEIFDVERNNIQGGTIRVFVKNVGAVHMVHQSKLNSLLIEEEILYKPETWLEFSNKIQALKKQLHKKLPKDKIVCAYGSPAKFTTFCKVMEIDGNILKFVVDDAPLKQGRFTPGTHIPVVPSHLLYNSDVCVITAWNFAKQIMENNNLYKGEWIIPMEIT